MTAREKCKKAENTSELNSEISGGENKKKRKIRKKQFSSSEEGERYNYIFLQPPPLLEGTFKKKVSSYQLEPNLVLSFHFWATLNSTSLVRSYYFKLQPGLG